MTNTTKWLRWGTSKWHLTSDDPYRISTVCGQHLTSGYEAPGEAPRIQIDHLDQETVPEDNYSVCLRCIRSREKKLRERAGK